MVRTRRSSAAQTPLHDSRISSDTGRLEDTANRRSSRVSSKDAADPVGERKSGSLPKAESRKRSRERSEGAGEAWLVAKGDFQLRIPSCGGEIFSPRRSGSENGRALREVELGFQYRSPSADPQANKKRFGLVDVIKNLKDQELDLPPRYTMGTCNLDNPELVAFEARHAEVQDPMESLAFLKSSHEGSPACLHAALLKLNEAIVGYMLFSMRPTAVGTTASEPAAKIVKVLTDKMHEASIHMQRMIKWFTNNYAPRVKYFAAVSTTTAIGSALDAIGSKRIKGDKTHGVFVAPD